MPRPAALQYQFLAARAAESENRPECDLETIRADDLRDRQVERDAVALYRCRRFRPTWRVRLPTAHEMENFHGKRVHST